MENIDPLPINGEISFAIPNERVTIAKASTSAFTIGGLRYVRKETNFEWTTSIVARKNEHEHLLSMQVVCEALSTAFRLPPPKKPYFIRQALAELGGGTDGEVPVAARPFRLGEDEAHIAAALMAGTAHNRLPIVYVSSGFKGDYLVQPDDLARYLSGMAHVVVEPSRAFSNRLRRMVDSRNVYGGTVGIYWPDSSARKSYYVDSGRPTARVQIEVTKDIRAALANRQLKTDCTWSHLAEIVSRQRLDQLRSQGSTDLQEYVDTFDADLRAKDDRLRESEQEILRLTAEVRRLSGGAQSSGRGLLKRGREQDLYEHEIADLVVDALEELQRNALAGSRRDHLLTDLLAVNQHSGARERIEEEIKSLLRGYRDMDSRTRNSLTRLGFEIGEEGKHFKAVFQGDGRYTFSIPKTSSDGRSGLNLVSDIKKQLF